MAASPSPDDIERETVWAQHNQSLKNSLLICDFASVPTQYFHPPEMDTRIFESRALSAVTGIDYGVDALWKAAESTFNLCRAIMVFRENRHRDDDAISQDMFDESRGRVQMETTDISEPFDKGRWEAVKDRFYQLRGWDVGTGVPGRAGR